MKRSALLVTVINLAAWGPVAHAQFVDDNVSSDSYRNTGSGSFALDTLDSSNESAFGCSVSPEVCYGNSAFGWFALGYQETGNNNTGIGSFALVNNSSGSNNTAVGARANYYGTGSNNTAVGSNALSTVNESSAAGSTAVGYNALAALTSGNSNSALGELALQSNTSGYNNTAAGDSVLAANTTGYWNTGSGNQALGQNTTGFYNTAYGAQALFSNQGPTQSNAGAGTANTAVGVNALYANTTGMLNTAVGVDALYSSQAASYNSAFGNNALYSNTTGIYNTASGYSALYDDTSGEYNTALGSNALFRNKDGTGNTSAGYGALANNSTGNHNTALGFEAGYALTTGSNNIDIGNVGMAAESGTIRIGTTSSQTKAYIAGIYGTSVSGSAVVVSATGQLGVTVSSERFKTAIAPMGSDTAKLGQLRPVSFKLKGDASGTRQYGLIAEEVAKVYPELVIRGESGRIDGVRYDELAPMLLNEAQQQRQKIAAQAIANEDQAKQIAAQGAQLLELQRQLLDLRAILARIQASGEPIVSR